MLALLRNLRHGAVRSKSDISALNECETLIMLLVGPERALTSSAGQRSSLQRRKGLQKSENVRPDVAVLDLPFLQAHWWKLIIW